MTIFITYSSSPDHLGRRSFTLEWMGASAPDERPPRGPRRAQHFFANPEAYQAAHRRMIDGSLRVYVPGPMPPGP